MTKETWRSVAGIGTMMEKLGKKIGTIAAREDVGQCKQDVKLNSLGELKSALQILDFLRSELALEIVERNPEGESPGDPDEFLMYEVPAELLGMMN